MSIWNFHFWSNLGFGPNYSNPRPNPALGPMLADNTRPLPPDHLAGAEREPT